VDVCAALFAVPANGRTLRLAETLNEYPKPAVYQLIFLRRNNSSLNPSARSVHGCVPDILKQI
jgi:hypothetical protein